MACSNVTDQDDIQKREPPVLSHIQCALSVRMAAHLNQNNGALRHSWWDILIYVISAYPSSASLFSSEEVRGRPCLLVPAQLQVSWSRHASLFVSLSTATLNHHSQAWATDGAQEVHLCSKQAHQSKINSDNILNHWPCLRNANKTLGWIPLKATAFDLC